MGERLSNQQTTSFTLGGTNASASSSEGLIGRRIVAYLIDAMIIGLIGVVFFFVNVASFGLLSGIFVLAAIILPIAYHSYFISSDVQATLGQRAMGLSIKSANGQKIEWLQAVIQSVLFYMTLSFTSGLLLIWALFDNKGRCLHEILSNTYVVRD